MANTAPQTLSFGGNPATGEAPSTYNTSTGQQVATSPTAIASPSNGFVSDSTSGANPTALAQGVKDGTVTGSLNQNGDYIPPTTISPTLNSAIQQAATDNGSLTNNSGTDTNPGGDSGAGATSSTDTTSGDSGTTLTPSQQGLATAQASGEPAPQDSATGSSAVASYTPPDPTPTTNSTVDNYLSTNSNIISGAQDLLNYTSPPATAAQLATDLATVTSDKTTLSGLNLSLMNVNNLMSGTEDTVRAEIQSSGGFATNNEVLALTTARNKTLLQQATQIKQSIANTQAQITADTALYTSDKALASQQYTQRTAAVNTVLTNEKNVATAQTNSAKLLLNTMKASGVYATLQSDPQAVANFEQQLGWPPGALKAAATENEQGTVSTYQTNADGTVSKITTKNGQPVSNVEQKPKAPATGKGSNVNSTANVGNAINTVVNGFTEHNLIGKDGYVSPETYKGAKAAWIADGHVATTFDSKFSKFANPADLQDYR